MRIVVDGRAPGVPAEIQRECSGCGSILGIARSDVQAIATKSGVPWWQWVCAVCDAEHTEQASFFPGWTP